MAGHTDNFVTLISESKTINSDTFSLLRLILLHLISSFEQDGVTYRELKAGLNISDGNLYSNLKVLEDARYIKKSFVQIENKELDAYAITEEGREEFKRIKTWLDNFLR